MNGHVNMIHKTSKLWLSLALLSFFTAWSSQLCAADNNLKWQVTPFFGYSSSLDFEAASDSATTDSITAKEHQNWGFFLSKETPDPGMIELIYSHETTQLSPTQPDDLQIDYLHFAGALILGQGPRPYIGAGIGMSRFSAYESDTRPSLALALGIQPQLSEAISLRAEIRGYGTFLNDNSTFLCNENRCNMHIKGELMTQAQANIGITARF